MRYVGHAAHFRKMRMYTKKMLVRNPEFKRPHERTRHRWANNTEIDLNEMGRDDMNCN
jgi:hypothetical protein